MIIPAANWIAKYFVGTIGGITQIIKRVKIPIILVGIGAQSNIDYNLDFLSKEDIKKFIDFFEAISEKTNTIGVRGEFTKNFLSSIGINNVDVIGCPSMFVNGYNYRIDNKKRMINFISANSNGDMLHNTIINNKKIIYIDQDCFSIESLGDAFSKKGEPYYGLSPFIKRLVEESRYKFFGDIYTWRDFLEKEIDFTFGTRIHGNIISIISGNPSHLIVHDSRTYELAQYFSIPHTLFTDLDSDEIDIQYLYQRTDYSKFNSKYNNLLDNFNDFLLSNGLKDLTLYDVNEKFENRMKKNIEMNSYILYEEFPRIKENFKKKDLPSIQKNIADKEIKLSTEAVCNKYFRYPNETNERIAEGGLRLQSKYKQSIENKPLVTIITVVYNNENTLERCIKSVLNQTYDNIEYIVIDGGSTDGTLDIIKKYENSIDYYISEPDDGIYYAMNKGIVLARGDYLNFMNSDDEFLPNAISVSIKTILENKADGSVAHANMYDDKGKFMWVYTTRPFDETSYLTRNPCNHQTLFLSKEAYNKIGYFDTRYKYAADLISEYLVIKNNFNIVPGKEIIANCYFIGETNQNYLESEKEAYKVASEFTNFTENEHRILAEYLISSIEPKEESFISNLIKGDKLSKRQFHLIFSKYYKNHKISYPKYGDLVSVIIPVYNEENNISKSLESVLNQTYKNIEIIVVNDCSTDNTKEIVEEYIKKDSRIKLINKPKNEGLLQARLTGMKEAKGEYIYSVDADDSVLPEIVDETLQTGIEKQADIIQFPMQLEKTEKRYKYNWTIKDYTEYSENDFFQYNGNTWTLSIKKELILPILKKIDSLKVNYHEDYIINIILSAYYNKVYYIDKPYYIYCDSDTSMTRNYNYETFLNYSRDTYSFYKLMKEIIPIMYPKENEIYFKKVIENRLHLFINQINYFYEASDDLDLNKLYTHTKNYEYPLFISMFKLLNDANNNQLQQKDNQLQQKNQYIKNKDQQIRQHLQKKNRAIGTKIYLSNEDTFLGKGFSSGESWGRWTDGNSFSLEIKLDDYNNEDIEIVFSIKHIATNSPLYILVNGIATEHSFENNILRFPLKVVDKNKISIEVKFKEEIKSPKELSRGDETRKLGLGIEYFQIRENTLRVEKNIREIDNTTDQLSNMTNLIIANKQKVLDIQNRINQNDKWHRFGQMSRRRKLWTIGKVFSKKLKIYPLLKPFAKGIKRIFRK